MKSPLPSNVFLLNWGREVFFGSVRYCFASLLLASAAVKMAAMELETDVEIINLDVLGVSAIGILALAIWFSHDHVANWLLAVASLTLLTVALYSFLRDENCNCFGASTVTWRVVILDSAFLILGIYLVTNPRTNSPHASKWGKLVVGLLAAMALFPLVARNPDRDFSSQVIWQQDLLENAEIAELVPLPASKFLSDFDGELILLVDKCWKCDHLLSSLLTSNQNHWIVLQSIDRVSWKLFAHDEQGEVRSVPFRWRENSPFFNAPLRLQVVSGKIIGTRSTGEDG